MMWVHLRNHKWLKSQRLLCVIFGKIELLWWFIIYSGREFGTTSIEIHLKSCKKKWEIEEGKKPPKERRPLPEPPK